MSLDRTQCLPLKTMDEVNSFMDNPPPWRSLCQELQQHSVKKVINMSVNPVSAISIEEPRTFCHKNLTMKPFIDTVMGVRQNKKNLPKTLVCHDMANGYHDDSIVQGTSNFNGYTFYNWAGIDIFCYFSHHFVTIPPVGWINAGHAHGVSVIGTIITEWSEGTKIWDSLLQEEAKWQNFANILVCICKTLKFEGWLLNIENVITHPKNLLLFVKYFHELLHKEVRYAQLIWYDSVTIDGYLQWQNALNSHNIDFFDACDGIFTNYSWSVESIVDSVRAAGVRAMDLYIGVDVWGRNFFGGGKFNTQQAIDVTYQFECSVAIFAPAWTHEAMDEKNAVEIALMKGRKMSKHEKFYLRDRAFWDSLWPYLYTSLPCSFPFQTSFCRGHGLNYWHYGEYVNQEPWYKLMKMQYQPNANHGPHGYMLTTMEDYERAAELGINMKTARGIIEYRNSFVSRYKDSLEDQATFEGKRETESVGTVLPPVVESTLKRKVKSLFASFFRSKKSQSDISVPVEQKTTSDDSNIEHPKKSVEIEIPSTSKDTKDTNLSIRDLEEKAPSLLVPKSKGPNQPRFELSRRSLRKLTRLDSLHIMLRGAFIKTRYALEPLPEERPCMEQFFDDCFNGGSCLRINPSDKVWPAHRFIRLFYCHFRCIQPVVICVVTKTTAENPNQYLNVHLQLSKGDGRRTELRLIGKDTNKPSHKPEKVFANSEIYNVYPQTVNSRPFKNLQNYLLVKDPGFYVPVNNVYGWKIRYYEFHMPWSRIKTIDLVTGRTKGSILLGYFGITERLSSSGEDVPQSLDGVDYTGDYDSVSDTSEQLDS